jgi:hypothetical protein
LCVLFGVKLTNCLRPPAKPAGSAIRIKKSKFKRFKVPKVQGQYFRILLMWSLERLNFCTNKGDFEA